MLTIKHIEPTGHETIWPAIRVTYQPESDFERAPPKMWIDRMGERGLVDTIDIGSAGSFYVMNEQGKTIAKYDLGGWAKPQPSMAEFPGSN